MIRLDNVTKVYGDNVAVKELSFHIRKGEIFGLLGPNGAGKTTTLKMLAGLLIPTEGSLYIDGFDVQKNPMEAKRVTGFVPDKPFVYEKLSGAEFLEFVRDIYGVNGDHEVIEKQRSMIEMFGLSGRLNDLVESYSHGMRQKLILTSALLRRPKALIIDEPMVGLDAKGMRQVKELFRDVARGGSAALVSTHTMAVAEEVCDRVGIMNKGELVAEGSVSELRDRLGKGELDLESLFLEITGR
ncbi:Efflux ABC transporter, ATP-binding protein [hydrothermal vent metagenome]|uniref:Efflux ABC transporter, ATP-binding protein n=1 Tax=hydrothermal vent metagenome TaxID=652676 RepID=A0A3B1BMT5_9ZZZZ